MSRARLFAVVVLVACNDHGSSSSSAPPDAPMSYCNPPPPPSNACQLTCGNNTVDTCSVYHMTSTCYGMWVPSKEECDGANTPRSCEEAGFFGGMMMCSGCRFDTQSCDPCAPGTVACISAQIVAPAYMATSGTRVALGDDHQVAVFDGTQIVNTVPVAGLWGIAGTSNGWLLSAVGPRRLVPMSFDGTLGTARALADVATYADGIAVIGNRVLVASSGALEGSQGTVHAEIRDEAGAVVVARFPVFTGGLNQPSLVTDGTSFFIAAGGTLARITTAGVPTVVPGFPSGRVRLVWAGTTGWYIAESGSNYVVQRFDAAGATVGTPITVTLGAARDFIAGGNDVLVARFPSSRLEVVRLDARGTLGTPTLVGAGPSTSFTRMAHLGTDLVVSWRPSTEAQIARIAPPQ